MNLSLRKKNVKLTKVIAVRKDLITAVRAFVGTIVLAEG